MNKIILSLISISFCINGFSQNTEKPKNNALLKELAENGCKCVDSIDIYNKSDEEVSTEIGHCIDEQVGAYQIGSKLINVTDLPAEMNSKSGKKEINVSIDMNKDSKEYKDYYFEMERYMLNNCPSVKEKIASHEKQNTYSMSLSPKALEWYSKGLDEMKKDNVKKALKYFKSAVEVDPIFAFAWDNIGLCYRKLEDYDEAIAAYQKSLEIDSRGVMPLQNIAVVYQYKGEYQKAIDAYKRLAELDEKNPEIYYGIGRIYATNLNQLEEGLINMCTAYNLYVELKSPYRTDAESIIGTIYIEMKKQGMEDKFMEILKSKGIQAD
ncbi:MAG TPA: tetratricopeptide repeat protein [Chryseolinea sp.]|mgnify:CR=1 FL=1|nr:tetratricopeptide repeat protein [Chryseolinea sp.]